MDDATGVALAIEHLVSLGHRRIGHLSGPSGLDPVVRREQAFRAQARKHRLEAAPVVPGEFSEESGAAAFEALLAAHPSVTAVYTATVSQALGVLNAAWRLGLRVPEELSLVAHADMSLACFLVPPLTGVQMPLGELGAAAVDALVEQIQTGVARNVLVETPPQLAVRASTGSPRVERRLKAAKGRVTFRRGVGVTDSCARNGD
jgi:LacI family transcriptional regulator